MGAQQRAVGYSSVVLFFVALRLLLPTIGRSTLDPLLADLQQGHRDTARTLILEEGFPLPENDEGISLVEGALTHAITSARIQRDIYLALREAGVNEAIALDLSEAGTYTLGLANEIFKDLAGTAQRPDIHADLYNNEQGYDIFRRVNHELSDSTDIALWDERITSLAVQAQQHGRLNDDFTNPDGAFHHDAWTWLYFNKEWVLPAVYAVMIAANELRIHMTKCEKDTFVTILTEGNMHSFDEAVGAFSETEAVIDASQQEAEAHQPHR